MSSERYGGLALSAPWLWWCSVLLSGCADKDASADPATDSAQSCPFDTGEAVGTIEQACRCEADRVEAGTGETVWEPIEDGSTLGMVHGPQDGWHLLGAVRAFATLSVVTLQGNAWDVETGQRLTTEISTRVQLHESDQACMAEYPDIYLYLDPSHFPKSTIPAEVACRDVLVELCATDSLGRGGCDTATVWVTPDPSDVKNGMVESCDR